MLFSEQKYHAGYDRKASMNRLQTRFIHEIMQPEEQWQEYSTAAITDYQQRLALAAY